jgi:hypothetical protein
MVSKDYFPLQLERGTPSEGLKQPEREAIVHLPCMPSGFVSQSSVFVTNMDPWHVYIYIYIWTLFYFIFTLSITMLNL